MQVFKDRNGRSWSIDITVGSIRRIKAERQIDIGDLIRDKEPPLDSFLSDKNLLGLFDVLFVLCRDDCQKAGLDQEAFEGCFEGQSIADAKAAFREAYLDFFSNRAIVPSLKAITKLDGEIKALGAVEMEKTVQAKTAADLVAEALLEKSTISSELSAA